MFDEITNDRDVCANCFRRTHDRFERNYGVRTYVNDDGDPDVWLEGVDGYPDEVYRRPNATDRIPSKSSHRGMTTVCDCGYRYVPQDELDEGETWKNRPIGRWDILTDYAANLIERLEESGVPVDVREFYDTLHALRSGDRESREEQWEDEMLEKAVDHAVANT